MKINVFRIPQECASKLEQKMGLLSMALKHIESINGWTCKFYLSTKTNIDDIPWVKDYSPLIPNISDVKNVIHYAIYLCSKDENHFALTYGKSHFYVRKFCDLDFGLEMAKRIADENDVKQTASKRFSGRKKREIKSFIKNTKLDSESGESVDYISAAIIQNKQTDFGEKSKFGSSLIISKEDLTVAEIPDLLDVIVQVINTEAPRFDLPKTSEVKDPTLISEYTQKLLDQLKSDISSMETEDSSYDLVGTDFVFYTNEKYTFMLDRKRSQQIQELSHTELRKFIDENDLNNDDILKIRVEITNENNSTHVKSLYEMIEYMVPDENVVLEQGKWKQFNEEYIEQINTSLDSITLEPTESQFTEIALDEPHFNKCEEISKAEYTEADTDFSKVNIGTGYKVEAWDLQKDDTVYAFKFGTPKKLDYVCSQAINMLEIIRNNANLKKLNHPPKKYCLWLGFERENIPKKISEINSIILKQHIDMFARKCREIGIEPVLKFSRKVKLSTHEK